MTDAFFFAAPAEPDRDALLKTLGHMLGSIDWDQMAQFAVLLTGQLWSHDHLEWAEPEGDTQVGRIPQQFGQALARVRDDQLDELAEAWRQRLGGGFFQDSLARDIAGLRSQARQAVAQHGSLWLRIES